MIVVAVQGPPRCHQRCRTRLPTQETEETWVQSLGWEDPLEEGMATHTCILPGESRGQRSLEGYSPWGHKESDTTEATSYACTELYIQAHLILPTTHSRSHCLHFTGGKTGREVGVYVAVTVGNPEASALTFLVSQVSCFCE